MNAGFWKGKKVLLTGHTGFKGSWLSLWLQKLRANLIGFALPASSPSLFEAASVAEGMTSLLGDIRDFLQVRDIVKQYRPEIVIHMAAQPLVLQAYHEPLETYSTNIMGSVNLFEAIRQVGGVKVIINVTSDKCYESHDKSGISYVETDRMGGYDPYSSSKACAELVTSAFRSSYFHPKDFPGHGVSLASARAGNVIGGGDWAKDRLVPDIARALIDDRPIMIRNPDAIRPWQHVLEPLSGYLLLAERLWSDGSKYSEGWNFGPNPKDLRPVSWIVERMASKWADDAKWKFDSQQYPHEARFLSLDCSKAKERLGWVPRTDLAVAIDWVVDWYKTYDAGKLMRPFTESQIEMFTRIKDNDPRNMQILS